jgi:fumarate reductase subunit D
LASPVVVALGQESAQRQFFVVVVVFLFFTGLNKCQKIMQNFKIGRNL